MLPFPPPILPEPITVPNNAADAPYHERLNFIKKIGFLNLGSLALTSFAIYGVFNSELINVASRFSTEVLFLGSVASLVALSFLRNKSLILQLLTWVLLIGFVSSPSGFFISQLHDSFPIFTECVGIAIGSCWFGIFLYYVFCGRDFSFFGLFCLVYVFALVVVIGLTLWSREVAFVEGMTIVLAVTIFLYYWVYDMAMILRRRRLDEAISASLDPYRDVLNFVGFPVRVLRMRKRKGRVSA